MPHFFDALHERNRVSKKNVRGLVAYRALFLFIIEGEDWLVLIYIFLSV